MKGFIAGALVLIAIIFFIDPLIVNWIVGLFPDSVSEWKGLIKLGAWIIILSSSFGLSLLVSIFVGMIVNGND